MYTTVQRVCTAQCRGLLSLKARPAAACACTHAGGCCYWLGGRGAAQDWGRSAGLAAGRASVCRVEPGGSRYSAASTVSPAVDQCGPASATADSDHSAAPLHTVHDIPGLRVRGPALLLPQPARHDAGRPQPQSGCSPARNLLSQRSQPYSGQNSKCTVLSQPLITPAVQFAGGQQQAGRQDALLPRANTVQLSHRARPHRDGGAQ